MFSLKAGKRFDQCKFEVGTGWDEIQCSVKIVQSANCYRMIFNIAVVSLQPTKVLGIYTFTKRVALEEFENKPRKQQGYSTVSHFNIVHYDCHLAAVRYVLITSWVVVVDVIFQGGLRAWHLTL